jgi:hypothetical protein
MGENRHVDRQPHVGIVFLVGERLYVDSTPLSDAGGYGDFRIHEGGHDAFFETLGIGGEYEAHPRARVAYDTRTQEFTLLADRCILARAEIVAEILRRMDLPTDTKLDTDTHYRCSVCLGR